MTASPPAATRDFDGLARLCKGTGDPLRLEILRVLKTDSFGVLELCDILGIKQPALSHHLKVLANTGAVTTRREGNSVFYRRELADPGALRGPLLAALFAAVDRIALDTATARNIARIKHAREEAAREFFDRHAERFREQQDLIAPCDQYLQATTDLLRQTGPDKRQVALEIGPGEGEFLPALARLFKQVTAIDISGEMLDKAGIRIRQQRLRNVDLLQADTAEAVRRGIQVDRIACNMVLHHVPSPADVFRDCAHLLHAGGALIVTDLCRHDQDWARPMCGDLWLGFDPEELTGWAQSAGLESKESLYLGLKNGFQIQVRRFDKTEP